METLTNGGTSPVFPDLAIITVNLNLKYDTAECLQSLKGAGASLHQCIVVDNSSTDDSVQFLRNTFGEQLTVLTSTENLGYAHGLNTGITYLRGNTMLQWFLLINNDTIVSEDFLFELEKAARSQKNLLLGPVIYYYDEPDTIWGFGDRFIKGTLIGRSLYKDKKLPLDVAPIVPIDIMNGCCMLVHRSVFDRIGLFDIAYFMYAEEVDFSWRARQAGFRIANVTSAKMWHKVSVSANKIRDYSVYLRVRNQNIFYRKYSNFAQTLIMVPFSLLRNLALALRYWVTGLPRLSKSVVRGWVDGWFA